MADREKGGFWVGAAAALFYPLTWMGRSVYRNAERIPRSGPALLVLNHISHLDPAVDAVFVHRNGRVPRFMAKDSLFRTPIFGKIIAGSGGIPVYRDSSDAGDSLRAAHRTLQEGKIVVIYPEGTINGYTKKFRPLPRKTVYHYVGEPVDLSAYRERKRDQALLREVTELIMDRVLEQLVEIRGEQPPSRHRDSAEGRA